MLCSNYIVEFPPNVTPEQRALITAAVFQPEYYYFERRGGRRRAGVAYTKQCTVFMKLMYYYM